MTSRLRLLHVIIPIVLLVIPGAVVMVEAADPPRVAFVTSWFGGGDLSTWMPAGVGADGLDAADWVCQYLAQDAGLDRPEDFVAWLSDSNDDAYCRIHGFTGKKTDNCGLTELPSNAGPWVRTDGAPFAERIYLMLGENGQVKTPAVLDENGIEALELRYYFTATHVEGGYDYHGACSDWTSSATVPVVVGDAFDTTKSWTEDQPVDQNCEGPHRLLCMQTGPGAPLPPSFQGGAMAFVTSPGGAGDLSQWLEAGGEEGRAAADSVCRLRADAAGLPAADSFVAFLSDSGLAEDPDAVDRLTLDGPWIRTDGLRIAQTRADLVDGRLDVPLNVDEFGTFYSNWGAWTGTTTSGLATGADCVGWTAGTSGATGTLGLVNTISGEWVEAGVPAGCGLAPVRLYCFSNAFEVLFKDDMESAGLAAWSAVYPP